jgi:hypothetical protein
MRIKRLYGVGCLKNSSIRAGKERTMTRHFSNNWPKYLCNAAPDFRKATLGFILVVLLSAVSLAQKPAPVPAAPIPPQILAAKKIFIANAGGDEMTEDDPVFSGGPARAYNQFYAAMKTWGRFEIVASPAEADLLFEVRQDASAVSPAGKGASVFFPQFRLKIRDPKTNALLWGFNVHAEFGFGQGASDRNFDQAVDRLVADVQGLVGMTPSTASSGNR